MSLNEMIFVQFFLFFVFVFVNFSNPYNKTDFYDCFKFFIASLNTTLLNYLICWIALYDIKKEVEPFKRKTFPPLQCFFINVTISKKISHSKQDLIIIGSIKNSVVKIQ